MYERTSLLFTISDLISTAPYYCFFNAWWIDKYIFFEKTFYYLGAVTIVALGPLTNIAMAMKLDANFESKVWAIH